MGSLIYLHGFRSSPAGWKSRLLAETLKTLGIADRFDCPALSPVPNEAIAQITTLITQRKAQGQSPALVGSSLGGFYAHCLAEQHDLKAVLLNPVVLSGIDPKRFVGSHQNFHSAERFDFTAEHIAQLASLNRTYQQITPERFLLMVETGDEVLDYRHATEHYASCQQIVVQGGDHGFQSFAEHLPSLLKFVGLDQRLQP